MDKTTKLPNTLGELLEVALQDLRKCEESDEYTINMLVWYETNGRCYVCMAGAVMAKSLGYDESHQIGHNLPVPIRINDSWNAKLEAINELRKGHIERAMLSLNRHQSLSELDINHFDDPFSSQMRSKINDIKDKVGIFTHESAPKDAYSYDLNRDKFMKTMEALATELKKHSI